MIGNEFTKRQITNFKFHSEENKMPLSEGEEVEITLRGKVTDGKLVLQGEIAFEEVAQPVPPEPDFDPPEVLSVNTLYPTEFKEVQGAERGFEYVAPWYQRSDWFLFSSVQINGTRHLAVKEGLKGEVRTWPYEVVHCSIVSTEHYVHLYTIEREADIFVKFRYSVSLSRDKHVALTNRGRVTQVHGDVANFANGFTIQKQDVFSTTHNRYWKLDGHAINPNLNGHTHQIYTLTMIEHKERGDTLVGLAGIFRIDEQNGKQQIGPIYPVWCYIKDNTVYYPFGTDKAFGRDGINPGRMVIPGGTMVRWGKELRFGLTYNHFAHTRWAPGATQNNYLMRVDHDDLMEAMGL